MTGYARKPVRIADLKHRVTVCAADEVIVDDTTMALHRRVAFDAWACIDVKRGSAFAPDGTVVDAEQRPTHRITIRARADREITAAAWLYEERRIGPARWYRILDGWDSTGDGRFWTYNVRMMQRADSAPAPASDLIPAYNGPREN